MFFTYGVPLIITVILALLGNAIFLPPLSLLCMGFYVYIILLCVIFAALHFLFLYLREEEGSAPTPAHVFAFGVASLSALILVVGWTISTPIFRATAYSSRLGYTVESSISNLGFTIESCPLLTQEAAATLAMQKLEATPELTGSFTLQSASLVSLQGAPTYIFALDYASSLKALMVGKAGIPAFLTVDMRSQETSIHYTNEPIQYTPGSVWGKDLVRHIHFSCPTFILSDTPHLEVDDNGTPFYIAPVKKPAAPPFGAPDIVGVVAVDPCSGSMEFYAIDEVPEWIDSVIPPALLLPQLSGLTTASGERPKPTDGYGILNNGQTTFLYTCLANQSDDSMAAGFILVNLRTKGTQYFLISGADEAAAMEAAVASVETQDQVASFPSLLMVEGTPTYCMTLSSETGEARTYAMVNYARCNLTATGQTWQECQENYRKLVLSNDIATLPAGEGGISGISPGEVSGRVIDIRTGDKDGTTHFYLRLENNDTWYVLSLKDNEDVIKLNLSDTVVLSAESGTLSGNNIPAKLLSFTEGSPW